MTLSRSFASTAGLGLGFLADRLFGDPRNFHPVAGFGRLASALERRIYADDRRAGVAHVAVLLGGSVLLGLGVDRLCRNHPAARLGIIAVTTWVTLGGRSLEREGTLIAAQLGADRLAAARVQIRNLAGRDSARLSPAELARACVESIAENTSDAVVAPLLWGALAGVPGMLGYRAVNTLDAMVGHRSARYRNFGWAAARLDDLVNWLPARTAGLLAIVAAASVGGSPVESLAVVRRDAGQHPSPNAGVVEAAFAGALGVQLGGQNSYGGTVEDRGLLGTGRPVEVRDIARSNRLAGVVSVSAVALAVGLKWWVVPR